MSQPQHLNEKTKLAYLQGGICNFQPHAPSDRGAVFHPCPVCISHSVVSYATLENKMCNNKVPLPKTKQALLLTPSPI